MSTDIFFVFQPGKEPVRSIGITEDWMYQQDTFLVYKNAPLHWYEWACGPAYQGAHTQKFNWRDRSPEQVPKEYRAWVLLLA